MTMKGRISSALWVIIAVTSFRWFLFTYPKVNERLFSEAPTCQAGKSFDLWQSNRFSSARHKDLDRKMILGPVCPRVVRFVVFAANKRGRIMSLNVINDPYTDLYFEALYMPSGQ
jgi:hypothetical protein